ncbi:MAG: orotate phosphoribosyltransferase [Thermodesulfovibrionia bacterium]|nr:orotate phosphoribosyltransferase [Thermodesulfovibrionia bacterium]
MEQYKQDFIAFLATTGALQFGEFTLKSGRLSPYFVNTGTFDTGEQIATLGNYYAQAIKDAYGDNFDVLYGPAYKGIPLAVAAASSLAKDFGMDKAYTFNRKEIKDYGDKKLFVGHEPQYGERIVIIDDVITDGGALIESMDLLEQTAKLKYTGVILSVNRQEKTKDDENAIVNFETKYKMPINFIVTISEIMKFLHNNEIDGTIYIDDDQLEHIEDYLSQYGV